LEVGNLTLVVSLALLVASDQLLDALVGRLLAAFGLM
jgi:hypothetical protein